MVKYARDPVNGPKSAKVCLTLSPSACTALFSATSLIAGILCSPTLPQYRARLFCSLPGAEAQIQLLLGAQICLLADLSRLDAGQGLRHACALQEHA